MKKNLRRVFKVVVLKYVNYCFFFTLAWGKKSEMIQFDVNKDGSGNPPPTPLKFNMEHNHVGLVQIIFLSFHGCFVGSSR